HRSRNLHQHLVVLDPYGVRRHRGAAAGKHALARAHVVHPAVPRARQTRAGQLSFAQGSALVHADVAQCVDSIADTDEADALAVRLPQSRHPGRELCEPQADLGHISPLLASDGGAPAPRRLAARTTSPLLASDGGAPAPRRLAARTTSPLLASDGGAPAPRRLAARTTSPLSRRTRGADRSCIASASPLPAAPAR